MKKQLQGYAAGVMSTLLILGGAAYAKSRTENINVTYDGINVYIDNALAELKDANGTNVEPFIYNGTTYLPVRGVAQAMGAQVTWDGATKSVYLWDKMVPGNTSFLDVCEPYSKYSSQIYSDGKTFKMDGKSYSDGIHFNFGEGYALFNLDGRYRTLSVDIGHYDDDVSWDKNVSFIVDGKTVKTITIEAEQLVKHVTIPLNYGLQMKIVGSEDTCIANMVVE